MEGKTNNRGSRHRNANHFERYGFSRSTATLARLNADPVASDLAPAFASRLDEFRTLAANEITLTEARLHAQAAVDQADGILDSFVDEFAAALLIDVNKDRKSPKFRRYFGSNAVAAFRRPVLNEELEGCRCPGSFVGPRGHAAT